VSLVGGQKLAFWTGFWYPQFIQDFAGRKCKLLSVKTTFLFRRVNFRPPTKLTSPFRASLAVRRLAEAAGLAEKMGGK